MQGILIDLDGVIYQNNQAIAGAKEAVDWLNSEGIPYLFVTNTTSKPLSAILEKLVSMGIDVSPERILTPVVAAQIYLERLNNPSLGLFVVEATAAEFSQWNCVQGDDAKVDAVVLGDLGEKWSFEQLNRAFRLLMANSEADLIALGMTRYWHGSTGLQLDVGPFAQALAYASGRTPKVMGKPEEGFFDAAAAILNLPRGQLAMIGDDVISDVAAAEAAGITGILVKTGKFRPTDLDKGLASWVLESISELPRMWYRLSS